METLTPVEMNFVERQLRMCEGAPREICFLPTRFVRLLFEVAQRDAQEPEECGHEQELDDLRMQVVGLSVELEQANKALTQRENVKP
jgi:hypothetical protein